MKVFLPYALLIFAIVAVYMFTLHRRRTHAIAGTAPNNFPPESVLPVGGIAVANKLGLTAAFTTTVFWTAPTPGYYAIGWNLHIQATDAAGTLTATVTPPPDAVAIPGVQANLATPADGHGPVGVYWMPAGGTITAAVAAGSLGVTTYDFTVFVQRMS